MVWFLGWCPSVERPQIDRSIQVNYQRWTLIKVRNVSKMKKGMDVAQATFGLCHSGILNDSLVFLSPFL